MNEADAAMIIGNHIGAVLVWGLKVPAVLATPVAGIIGLAAFLIGKKHERRWSKNDAKKLITVEDVNQLIVPTEEGDESAEINYK